MIDPTTVNQLLTELFRARDGKLPVIFIVPGVKRCTLGDIKMENGQVTFTLIEEPEEKERRR